MTTPGAGSGAKGKVLVVDDSEPVLELTRAVLEQAGYEVLTMESALRLPAVVGHEKPDVVLLDVRMPSLKGDRALRMCKDMGLLYDTAVVLYSDSPERELEEMARAAGAAGFLKKSSETASLLENIRIWVAWSRNRRALREAQGGRNP